MKKTVGFVLFRIGFGIFLTLFLPEENFFIRILLSAVFLICGYLCYFSC